ncbi:MAG: hypothetical protein AXW14_04125 [Alteromonas sp. Nap_26]|nr:MAG: hypothetical protein AXW14_04125 [Alteromonas sp. Nap_26]
MKRLLVALMLCSSAGNMAMAQSTQKYEALADELEIMSGVLKTSLKQNVTSDSWRVNTIESNYLAGQGAVFTMSVRGHSGNWAREIETMVESVVAAVPPAPTAPSVSVSLENIDDIVFEATREWEAYADAASMRVSEVFSDSNDKVRELRNMQREVAWQAREVEREIRDISFELRHADEERKKELLAEKEASEQKLVKVEAKAKTMKDELKVIEKEQAQKRAERKEKQQQAYRSFLAGFEVAMSETLCRFGAGLRGLPESEHISMVLKDFDADDNNVRRDRIYVFSRKEVVKCVQEKIDENALLANATIYSF